MPLVQVIVWVHDSQNEKTRCYFWGNTGSANVLGR